MKELGDLVSQYFPYEKKIREAEVSLNDRWIQATAFRFLFFPRWYFMTIPFVETENYYFFDKRRSRVLNAALSCFIITMPLFIYFLLLSVRDADIIGLVFPLLIIFGNAIVYLRARSAALGIMVIKKEWIKEQREINGGKEIRGAKPYGEWSAFGAMVLKEGQGTPPGMEGIGLFIYQGSARENLNWYEEFVIRFREQG